MKSFKVFIDGEAGTTGLKILERVQHRKEIELLEIAQELRKDPDERKRLLNSADFVFLCLPDDAAKQSVSLVENPDVCIIDASTAHRTHPDWVYGLPELSAEHEQAIRASKRVSVPGCYASGFTALMYPLVKAGIVPADMPVYAHGVSGYSGAGRAVIEQYENERRNPELGSARLYALTQEHKHIPEMQLHSGLAYPPMFNPIIDDFYRGMVVCVPLQTRLLRRRYTAADIIKVYEESYMEYPGAPTGKIKIMSDFKGSFIAAGVASSDNMELFATGDEGGERILLTARLDNLGKGASGAAIQCFELIRNN